MEVVLATEHPELDEQRKVIDQRQVAEPQVEEQTAPRKSEV